MVPSDAEKAEIEKDFKLGLAVSFAVAFQEVTQALRPSSHLPSVAAAIGEVGAQTVYCALLLLFAAWARMMLDTAPATKSRQELASFVKMVLQTTLGWVLALGLAVSRSDALTTSWDGALP